MDRVSAEEYSVANTIRLYLAIALGLCLGAPSAGADPFISVGGLIHYQGFIGAKADVYGWDGTDSYSGIAPTLPANGGAAFDGVFTHTGTGGCCSGDFIGTAGVSVHSLANYRFNGNNGFALSTDASIALSGVVTGADAGITTLSTSAYMTYDFRFAGTAGTPFHFASSGMYDQFNVMYFWDMTSGATFAQTSGSGYIDNPLSFDVSGTLTEGDVYELYIGHTSPGTSVARNTFASLTVGDPGPIPEPASILTVMVSLGAMTMARRRRR